jgi:NADPH:quinone reductase-like Zn-dependent oxidoreductase
LPLPHVGGSDIAGTVEQVGGGVLGWSKGDRVAVNPSLSCGRCDMCAIGEDCLCKEYRILGEHTWGGFAEFVKVPAANLVRIPEGFKFETAAAAPLASMTAWRAVVTRGGLRAGETLLVIGGGGGVATFAIQIGKLCGARVICTTGSDDKAKRLRALGADETVVAADGEFGRAVWDHTGRSGADVVVDYSGKDTWPQALRCVRKRGRLLTCGATSGYDAITDLRYVWVREIDIRGSDGWTREDLVELLRLVERRELRPVVHALFPLSQVRAALAELEERRAFGKVIVIPDALYPDVEHDAKR